LKAENPAAIRIALTPGDPAGIGPEITWKLLQKRGRELREKGVEVLVIGAEAPFRKLGAPLNLASVTPNGMISQPASTADEILLLPAPNTHSGGLLAGWQSGWAIETAAHLLMAGECAALVTGPIHKERLQAGGWKYSGHTDFLADLFHVPAVTMMLANSHLRVSLVTVHTALENVPSKLSEQEIERALIQTAHGLAQYWNIRKPRIWVCALNPHAGEGGLFGSQERTIIQPAIQAARAKIRTATIEGPFPSDTLFARAHAMPIQEKPDAVVAMYHDQGLIPVKLLDFAHTVNLTLGLPAIRTSVDHGTAFDIAGRGIADPSSLEAALDLAIAAAERARPS
jgi:4-hydroxythreonine-4-phosphate dehydrogenase